MIVCIFKSRFQAGRETVIVILPLSFSRLAALGLSFATLVEATKHVYGAKIRPTHHSSLLPRMAPSIKLL
jgi:hypothetical protein